MFTKVVDIDKRNEKWNIFVMKYVHIRKYFLIYLYVNYCFEVVQNECKVHCLLIHYLSVLLFYIFMVYVLKLTINVKYCFIYFFCVCSLTYISQSDLGKE